MSYIGANSHGNSLGRTRKFVWAQGTRKALVDAMQELDKAHTSASKRQARSKLQEIITRFPDTQAAWEAQQKLQEQSSEALGDPKVAAE